MINRSVVYWLGAPPSSDEFKEFANRSLRLSCISEVGDIDLRVARGLVINARAPAVSEAAARMAMVKQAVDSGLMVYALCESDAVLAHLKECTPASDAPALPHVRFRTGSIPPHECAENIARHLEQRHASNTLKLHVPQHLELSDEQTFFLRRAFSDCSAITIEPLTGGRSASAFLVQATLIGSEVGPRPLPFFAKVDTAEKIKREVANYGQFADMHIPWNLRPNLDPTRCLTGVDNGILVGSFVGNSESLWQAVLSGKGARCIHTLFEETLLGWRSQAYLRPVSRGNLPGRLRDVFVWQKVSSETLELVAAHGTVPQPKELSGMLLDLYAQSWRDAPMHGDMHGENVRIRNGDAIIIDLAKASTGPLCADVASLEVWLAFEVPPEPRLPSQDEWKAAMLKLFSPAEITRPPALAGDDGTLGWLTACIRQTRMVANAICECDTEYATVIAMYLLRRAQYNGVSDEDKFRRAFAYFLASRLIQHLSSLRPRQ